MPRSDVATSLSIWILSFSLSNKQVGHNPNNTKTNTRQHHNKKIHSIGSNIGHRVSLSHSPPPSLSGQMLLTQDICNNKLNFHLQCTELIEDNAVDIVCRFIAAYCFVFLAFDFSAFSTISITETQKSRGSGEPPTCRAAFTTWLA